MLTVQSLLAQAKARQGIASNYRLAKVLGAGENTVSNWSHGRRVPDDEMSVRLAELAELPPGKVLASMHALREPEGTPLRAAWLSLCIMLLSPAQARPRRRRSAAAIPG
jgi:transcriptional regulator with XRE-family HTH domain